MDDQTLTSEPVPANEPAAARSGKSIAYYMGAFALGGAVLAILVGVLSTTLARYGVIDKLPGFSWFMQMLPVAAGSAVIALVALVLGAVRKTTARRVAVPALILALGYLAVLYGLVINPAQSSPFLHDVTTDVDDPPEFRAIALRADNLDQFEGDIEAWRSAHRDGYPNIEPMIISKTPELVIADARAIAEEKGWEIVDYNPTEGRLEATAYAGYIRFMDDVVVEVTPIADGSTRVDMRSVSRVGGSDLGYNAKRIREFFAELETRG